MEGRKRFFKGVSVCKISRFWFGEVRGEGVRFNSGIFRGRMLGECVCIFGF